jgi:hypothetical protein
MLLFLQDAGGRTVEALLLAISPNRMRLVIRDFRDAVEIEYAAGQWKTEKGKLIEIVGMITDDRFKVEDVFLQARAAG